jgi:hypothetical protein
MARSTPASCPVCSPATAWSAPSPCPISVFHGHSIHAHGDRSRGAPAPLSGTAPASPDYRSKPTAWAMPVRKAAL